MRLPFLDRREEHSRLTRAFSRKTSTLCCLYGRRRCGKSRLLQEVLPADRSVYFVADERESPLQRAALAQAMASILPNFDAVSYPDWSSLLERWWQESPANTILALDEFPYLVQGSPELPSLLQKLVDRGHDKARHVVLCGSSQRMMHGLVLDAAALLYGG